MKSLNSISHCLLLSFLFPVLVSYGQEDQPEKKDPYTRKSADQSGDSKPAAPESNLVIAIELVEMNLSDVMKGEKENLPDTDWRKFAQEKVKSGEAEIVNSTAVMARSGQRTKLESSLALQIPAERKKLEFDSEGPLFPVAMRSKPVGLIFEVDPILEVDRKTLNLSYAIRFSRYLGESPGARLASDRLLESDVMFPAFAERNLTSQSEMRIGESFLLTKFDAEKNEEGKERVQLMFGRFDVIDVADVVPSEKLAEIDSQLNLRNSVVEISAEIWHEWLAANDLPFLFGGEAWKRVEEAASEGKSGISIVATPRLRSKSGSRAKVESGQKVEYPSAFESPVEVGGKAIPAESSQHDLGTTWETDCVITDLGRIHVNQRIQLVSEHGQSVSYRSLVDGAWVPSVHFPKLFSAAFTGQCVLAPDANILVGVGTPPTESGEPDLSKKVLFFVHNDTFVEP